MASGNHVPLLWTAFPRLCLPLVLFVRQMSFGLISSYLTFRHSMRYSRMLEESSYANRKADYLWLLTLSAGLLLIISPLVTMPFLSAPLAFVPIYIWSRSHPSTHLSLFGLVTITAPYLPVALVAFSWLINGNWSAAMGDLLGCVVGHVAWFGKDVWEREAMGGPSFISRAPTAL